MQDFRPAQIKEIGQIPVENQRDDPRDELAAQNPVDELRNGDVPEAALQFVCPVHGEPP